MAKQPGRLVLIKVDTTGAGAFSVIGGMRTKSATINSEQVDVTSDSSVNQWRELLAGAGVKSMSISGSGVFEDDAAFGKCVDYALGGLIQEWQLIYPGFGTFEGLFQVAGLDLAGEYNAETNYSFSLESAGEIAFTAAV